MPPSAHRASSTGTEVSFERIMTLNKPIIYLHLASMSCWKGHLLPHVQNAPHEQRHGSQAYTLSDSSSCLQCSLAPLVRSPIVSCDINECQSIVWLFQFLLLQALPTFHHPEIKHEAAYETYAWDVGHVDFMSIYNVSH